MVISSLVNSSQCLKALCVSSDYWYLHISPDEFMEIYDGLPVIKSRHLFERPPMSDVDAVENYFTSKLWRLNNWYGIRDKFGTPLKFNMNRAQHLVYATFLRHPRIIILKSRQQGISTFWLVTFFDDAVTIDNMNIGLMAQDKDAASDLLERVDWAWDDMAPVVTDFLNIKRIVNNSKETSFSNGSKIYVRTSFRSGTLQRLHISELGKIANKYPEKARETNTGSLQAIKAGNPVIIESTAEGRDNMFAHKWKNAVEHVGNRSLMHFIPLFLSWVDDPDCRVDIPVYITAKDKEYIEMVERDLNIKLDREQKWWAAAKRDELGEDFDREYPYNPESAFSLARDGTYYGAEFKKLRDAGRIAPDIFEPVLKVTVSFDIGMSDGMALLFWQEDTTVSGQRQVRLIDSYINSGEGLHHYVEVLKERNYKYERFVLPHDAKKRELGANASISQQLKDLGLKKQKVLPREDVLGGIQAVRAMIPSLWIARGVGHNDYVIQAFENYTKEWDSNRGVWKDKPRHDEWSDPMDSVRYYAVYSHKSKPKVKTKVKTTNVVDGLAM